MVLVNELREILGTSFPRFFVDVGPRTALLKGPIVPKHVIAIYEGDWKQNLLMPFLIHLYIIGVDNCHVTLLSIFVITFSHYM